VRCSGIEQRRTVMSKEQMSVKCDVACGFYPTSPRETENSEDAVVIDISDDDDDDDETEDADGMQFATETIIKNFARCSSKICGSFI